MNGVVALGTRQQQRLQTYKEWNNVADSSVVDSSVGYPSHSAHIS